jgi:hypothetical protein
MRELFEKQGRSIFTFKKGDIIIKLHPRIITETKTNENLGISTEVEVEIDNSYRSPVEFIGIENNIIYLRSIKEDSFWKKKIVSKAYLNEHSDDWELFVVPEGLTIDDCL